MDGFGSGQSFKFFGDPTGSVEPSCRSCAVQSRVRATGCCASAPPLTRSCFRIRYRRFVLKIYIAYEFTHALSATYDTKRWRVGRSNVNTFVGASRAQAWRHSQRTH